MKTTKSMDIALERAAALLGGEVGQAPGRLRRTVRLETADGRRYVESGTVYRCLYWVLFVAMESYGFSIDDLRDAIRLRGEGAPTMATQGVGAHELQLIRAIVWENGD